jgi:hypothetical protein
VLGIAVFAAFAAATPAASAQAAPAAAAATPQNPQDKIRCHSENETGSLAKRRKICMTVAEWNKRAFESSQNAARIVDAGAIQPTNGK